MKSLRDVERAVIEAAFDCGGFIAGGCPRYVTETIDHTGKYDEVDAHAYRQFGDVDIFFPNEESFERAIKMFEHGHVASVLALASVPNESNRHQATAKEGYVMSDSLGSFAQNVNITSPLNDGSGCRHIPIQFIRCQFGDPKTILSKFDFLNSMVVFAKIEGKLRGIRHKDWLENERSNTLSIFVWDSPLSFYRIHKYVSKYGYENIVDALRDEDRIMLGMIRTMSLLPNNPLDETGRKLHQGWSNDSLLKRDGDIIFTQQNYARHILKVVMECGHIFTSEMVVFMVSLSMTTGIINGTDGGNFIKYSEELRAKWDPKKISPRVVAWKESKRKSLEKKENWDRLSEVYRFTK